jgi:primosomal protein N' (replication factor Y)
VRKNILESFTKEISRIDDSSLAGGDLPILTTHQQLAIEQITDAFTTKNVVLLHGVTSSGKTELYINLIENYIRDGKQVLYLLPEIALTSQIINRLKAVFGSKVGIYHSKFTDAQRVEVWQSVNKLDGYKVILGVRSSVFLPFVNLGLIIVDEEHENTYKQFEPAPRYNARDVSVVLASLHGAKILLGTATPSIESYHNAMEGKYALVELTERYSGVKLPYIQIVDTMLARKQKKMQSLFHPDLITAIEGTLKNNKQVILFQNRRGFAPLMQCKLCEFIPRCQYCDVSMTYHKFPDRLLCHYCGYTSSILRQCPQCGGFNITELGFGTEKIEDELQIFFPDARIARLDLDSARARKNYEKIIADFEERKTDILVGTQMIAKGLDFENVYLSAVLNADSMLSFPDFRAYERAYQLITQVNGRAGRASERGLSIIQSSKPQHDILQYVIKNDYVAMYKSQIEEREKFKYPPFYRLIRLTLKHKSKETVQSAAEQLADYLTKIFGNRVLGPEKPIISRVQNYYLENILLKIEKQASAQKAKELLATAIQNLYTLQTYKSLQVVVDVDPA